MKKFLTYGYLEEMEKNSTRKSRKHCSEIHTIQDTGKDSCPLPSLFLLHQNVTDLVYARYYNGVRLSS